MGTGTTLRQVISYDLEFYWKEPVKYVEKCGGL